MTRGFDRVAHCYDETRGGEQRGRQFAWLLHPLFAHGGLTLEVGVGTGLIAWALQVLGRPVVGIDISTEMLAHATRRVPGRVAVGDATRMPVASGSMDNAYSVWVLHLVDIASVLSEVHRVLRPRGRYLVSGPSREKPADPLRTVYENMKLAIRGNGPPDHPDIVAGVAERAGFRVAGEHLGEKETHWESPNGWADQIEQRSPSILWDVDDERWESIVVPAIRELRAMPNPDEPRPMDSQPLLLVLDK